MCAFRSRSLRLLSALFAILTLISVGGCKDGNSSAADDLIQAFQSGCSKGAWTDAALGHNGALVAALNKLKAEKACAAHIASLDGMAAISDRVTSVLSDPAYRDYRRVEENLQELTLALQSAQADAENPASPDLIQGLTDAIVSAQVDLALKKSTYNVSKESMQRDQFMQSTLDLSTSMQSILHQSEGLGSCLQSSPAAAVQLATNVIAMGGSFISPIVGAAASVAGQLITVGVEFASQAPMDSAIKDLQSAKMPTALSCGLEAMTELYCQADEAYALLELQKKSYDEGGLVDAPFWKGMDILGRRLPTLNQWLLSLKNGVRPTDTFEAKKQKQILEKMLIVDTVDLDVVGFLSEQQRLHDAAAGSVDKRRVKAFAVRALASQLSGFASHGMQGSTPFMELSADRFEYACWFILGISQACPEWDPDSGLEVYIGQLFAIKDPGFMELFNNWSGEDQAGGILGSVKRKVDTEFSQTITADPAALLATALEPFSVDGVSPHEVLRMIEAFLSELRQGLTPDDANPNLLPLLDETLGLLADANDLLEDTESRENLTQDETLNRVTRLFDLFQLRRGTQFFNERVKKFVMWDLQRRIASGEIPQNAEEILLAAGGDIRERLLASGVSDLVAVGDDLGTAMSLTQSNLGTFRKFFKKSLTKAMQRLEKQAVEAREPMIGDPRLRPNRQQLAKLCALTLASGPAWPKGVPWELCEKAYLASEYKDPNGDLTLDLAKLDLELQNQPLRERMCAYHRYVRANRLAEILRKKPDGGSWSGNRGADWQPGWLFDLIRRGPFRN